MVSINDTSIRIYCLSLFNIERFRYSWNVKTSTEALNTSRRRRELKCLSERFDMFSTANTIKPLWFCYFFIYFVRRSFIRFEYIINSRWNKHLCVKYRFFVITGQLYVINRFAIIVTYLV